MTSLHERSLQDADALRAILRRLERLERADSIRYDAGAWTPVLYGGSTAGTTTYTVAQGYYVRAGALVWVTTLVGWSAATGTGAMLLGGLPYPPAALTNNVTTFALDLSDVAFSSHPQAIMYAGDGFIRLEYAVSNTAVAAMPMESAGAFVLSGAYRA